MKNEMKSSIVIGSGGRENGKNCIRFSFYTSLIHVEVGRKN
jgi:hypothetical protein